MVIEILKVFIIPICIFLLGILFIAFHKQIGNFGYKWQVFIEASYERTSHMKTLFKAFSRAFTYTKEKYEKRFFYMGISCIVFSLLFLFFLLWVRGII